MPYSPPIHFLGSSFLGKIPLTGLDPQTIIPLERPGTGKASGFPLAVYFQAIQQVIEKGEYGGLLGALSTRWDRKVTIQEIKEILLYSEKHGSDYHPARVEVCLTDRVIPLVMNVALTDRGRLVLANEFEVLDVLNRKPARSYLPQAYFWDEAEVASVQDGRLSLPMYLAEWLEGFYEFHLSRDPADGEQKLVLWDSARSDHYLPDRVFEVIFREIAYIVTTYYDLETFAQIHPWHLAAGDFIVRLAEDNVEVRLVAARQYGPLIGPPDLSREEALLFFLLNLSVRIRLDRLDGVGEVAWASDDCLRPMLEGFFLALKEKTGKGESPGEFFASFRGYLKSRAFEDLEGLFFALVDSGDPSAPDLPVIRKHLEKHIKDFFDQIRAI